MRLPSSASTVGGRKDLDKIWHFNLDTGFQFIGGDMSAKVTVNKNGSLKIEGDFELFDPVGGKYDLGGRSVISLCRCGQTENKPFCDGNHAKCGFQSVVVATVLPPKKA